MTINNKGTDKSQRCSHINIQKLQNSAGEGVCHFSGEHTLFVSLSSRPIHYLQTQDGKTHTGLYRRGDISVVPAGSPLFARWKGEENCLQIRLTVEFMARIARETLSGNSDLIPLKPTFQSNNPQLASISQMLLSEYEQGSLANQLYLDSLTNILAVNLLREHTTTQFQLPIYEGGLPQHQLHRVLEYVDAHLEEDIKLANLACLLDMSQFHFSRLFKQSIGISPYQYLIQQRVERAKQLLRKTNRLITDIAFDCGFNSHSHLSKQFRQLTGMTPKKFRAIHQ